MTDLELEQYQKLVTLFMGCSELDLEKALDAKELEEIAYGKEENS